MLRDKVLEVSVAPKVETAARGSYVPRPGTVSSLRYRSEHAHGRVDGVHVAAWALPREIKIKPK